MAPWTTGIAQGRFFYSFFLSSWGAMRSYRRYLEVWDPILGDDCRTTFIRRSPSWGFPGFSSGDLCTTPGIIPLSPLSLADKRDNRPLASNTDKGWWHRHTSLKLFSPQPMALWTTGHNLLRRRNTVAESLLCMQWYRVRSPAAQTSANSALPGIWMVSSL